MRLTPAIAATLLAGLAFAAPTPAIADVKAGVDAWAAGDFARAVSEWKGPAAKGDADALFNLAQAYRLGRGVPQDLPQAETLYARAAAHGHLKAADNYGLLLFQDGRREQAMPYITAAADRGDPRAQYLLGIAYFNGDLVLRDYVRAYALLTLANGAGLPQAAPALREMDGFVPLMQRQEAQSLAVQMRSDADSRRSAQMAAVDLGADAARAPVGVTDQPVHVASTAPRPGARVPQAIASVPVAPSSVAAAEAAVAEAMRASGTESPATAGADFARPALDGSLAQATRPASAALTQVARSDPPLRPAQAVPAGGAWKIQLGAFSVAGGADRLWQQLADKPVLAGKIKQTRAAGSLTRLLASGWSSAAAAQSACATLKASGQGCIVTR